MLPREFMFQQQEVQFFWIIFFESVDISGKRTLIYFYNIILLGFQIVMLTAWSRPQWKMCRGKIKSTYINK